MTCFPIFIVGFNDVIGSWKIIEMSFPRNLINSCSDFLAKSSPKKLISPFLIRPASPWNNLVIALVVTDFPEPDSPTIARVSPLLIKKSTPLTACTSPASISKETCKLLTSNTLSDIYVAPFCYLRILGSNASRNPSLNR